MGTRSGSSLQDDGETDNSTLAYIANGPALKTIESPSPDFTWAWDINDSSVVVGTYGLNNKGHAFKWSEEAGLMNLGSYDAMSADAIDINNHGDVLINAIGGGPVLEYEGYRYHATQTILHTNEGELRPIIPEYHIFHPSAVNEARQIAGMYTSIPNKQGNAYLWDQEQGLKDLGLAGSYSAAMDLNDTGEVVGFTQLSDDPLDLAAFVYDDLNGSQLLKELISSGSEWFRIEMASEINNGGQILGIAWKNQYFSSRAIVLLTPVPEPGTIAIGLIAVMLGATTARLRCASPCG